MGGSIRRAVGEEWTNHGVWKQIEDKDDACSTQGKVTYFTAEIQRSYRGNVVAVYVLCKRTESCVVSAPASSSSHGPARPAYLDLRPKCIV